VYTFTKLHDRRIPYVLHHNFFLNGPETQKYTMKIRYANRTGYGQSVWREVGEFLTHLAALPQCCTDCFRSDWHSGANALSNVSINTLTCHERSSQMPPMHGRGQNILIWGPIAPNHGLHMGVSQEWGYGGYAPSRVQGQNSCSGVGGEADFKLKSV